VVEGDRRDPALLGALRDEPRQPVSDGIDVLGQHADSPQLSPGWLPCQRSSLIRRKPYVPDVRPSDLGLPNEAGLLRSVVICTACAFCITVLYVGFPLYMASLVVPMGAWAPMSLGAVFLGRAIGLTLFSLRETREFRELINER
jgi:hypothetical protein